MFILWIKTWINDFSSEIQTVKKYIKGILAILGIAWAALGCISILTFNILNMMPESNLDRFAYKYFLPAGYVVLVLMIVAAVYFISIAIKKAYLDYSYFVANGGKRKRDEKRKNDEDNEAETLHNVQANIPFFYQINYPPEPLEKNGYATDATDATDATETIDADNKQDELTGYGEDSNARGKQS